MKYYLLNAKSETEILPKFIVINGKKLNAQVSANFVIYEGDGARVGFMKIPFGLICFTTLEGNFDLERMLNEISFYYTEIAEKLADGREYESLIPSDFSASSLMRGW